MREKMQVYIPHITQKQFDSEDAALTPREGKFFISRQRSIQTLERALKKHPKETGYIKIFELSLKKIVTMDDINEEIREAKCKTSLKKKRLLW